MVLKTVIIFCVAALLTAQTSIGSPSIGSVRLLAEEAPAVRESCELGATPSPSEVNTTVILAALRSRMQINRYDAYIITSSNDHQGEYIPEHDKRREYVSGFTGSAGDAVVTRTKAVLWTDSRYYLQAEDQLDCNWDLVRTGDADAPTIDKWLSDELPRGSVIAADAKILTFLEWKTFSTSFGTAGLTFQPSTTNPVDEIWTVGRPPYVTDVPLVHHITFAGVSWQDKMERVRGEMRALGCDAFVVSALDEIAWFLNLRGSDIPYSPFFRAYLVVENTSATVYLPAEKQTTQVLLHLNSAAGGADSVGVKNYGAIWTDLGPLALRTTKVLLPGKYSYAMGISQQIYMAFRESQVGVAVSPILKMRDFKNPVEVQGMINAHVRDAVALCQFLEIIDTGVAAQDAWDELSAASRLNELRALQELSMGPSFETISAFGPNSALPHYSPTVATNRNINDSSMFMLDSGGQYLDGTTDVTRTLHFGTPTDLQREIYTRLLIGCIRLASVRFPAGKTRAELEILIRSPLFGIGLDFGHGTTHGIGAFGGVHEAFDSTYHVNFFGSQEPGYYRDGMYGMRLENIVTVVKSNLSEFQLSDNSTFLEFETVTLVPYDRKLINVEMMSADEINWINSYYEKIRNVVGAEMVKQEMTRAHDWLVEQTRPINSGVSVALGKVWLLTVVAGLARLFAL